LQSAFQFVKTNRFLFPALSYYRQIVQIFEQLLVLLQREQDAGFPTFRIDNILFASSHDNYFT